MLPPTTDTVTGITKDAASPEDGDAALAVAAHRLLSATASITGFAELLDADWERLDREQRGRALGVISRQGHTLERFCKALVAGHPPDVAIQLAFDGETEGAA